MDIEQLQQQIRSDNEFYFTMMGSLYGDMKSFHAEMAQRHAEISQRFSQFEGNIDERMRQLEARHRLQEQRFTTILGATATREELQALERRVARLEQAS